MSAHFKGFNASPQSSNTSSQNMSPQANRADKNPSPTRSGKVCDNTLSKKPDDLLSNGGSVIKVYDREDSESLVGRESGRYRGNMHSEVGTVFVKGNNSCVEDDYSCVDCEGYCICGTSDIDSVYKGSDTDSLEYVIV